MKKYFSISQIDTDKKRFLQLLLIGDESENMIDRYLEHGTLFVVFLNDIPIAVCVITDESESCVEVKNLAVHPDYRKRGFGRALICVPDFFTSNYDAPIIEESVQLRDMIYLKKTACNTD